MYQILLKEMGWNLCMCANELLCVVWALIFAFPNIQKKKEEKKTKIYDTYIE